jgi:nucleotide-binding universal stress UspA family protein
MYKRILVPVDGSTTSELALREAASLAKEQNAAVRLAHVIDDRFGYAVLDTPRQIADEQAQLREAGERLLADAAAVARAVGVEPDAQLAVIDAPGRHIYDAIEKEAERWGADLIVIGTHGRRGFQHLLLGSVAEGLIRVTTRPVLLIRGA